MEETGVLLSVGPALAQNPKPWLEQDKVICENACGH